MQILFMATLDIHWSSQHTRYGNQELLYAYPLQLDVPDI